MATKTRGQNPAKGYDLTIWANGFREWHGKVTFTVPVGNTPEAVALIYRADKYAKTNLRRIIANSDGIGRGYRLRYEITANQTQPGSGRLVSVTYKVAN